MNNNADNDDDDDDAAKVVREVLQRGGNAIYAKGDKISIDKGDLTGLKGTVVSIED